MRNTNHSPKVSSATAIRTPAVTRASTLHLLPHSSSISTCMLPAKSRKLSAPFISAEGRFTAPRRVRGICRRCRAGISQAAKMAASETISAMTSTPMVLGRRKEKRLTKPNTAASVSRTAISPSGDTFQMRR